LRTSRWLNFISLPPGDRHLVVRAFLAVARVRLLLWLLNFKYLKRYLASCPRVKPTQPAAVDPSLPDKILRFIEVAGRYIPRTTCLTQALAAQALLNRYGFHTELSIGVAKDGAGQFHAHAWLERKGNIITGGCDLHRYSPFPSLSRSITEA
jgi:hypothetical protein